MEKIHSDPVSAKNHNAQKEVRAKKIYRKKTLEVGIGLHLELNILLFAHFRQFPKSIQQAMLRMLGRWDVGAKHHRVITMDLAPLPRRIKNTKVNSILYACQLGSLSDGILLDHPSSCIHRFELRTTRVEECKHKSTTTSCTREVCKKRKKKQGEDSRRPRKLRPTPQSFRPLELSASPTPTFANLLGIPKLARNFQPLPA